MGEQDRHDLADAFAGMSAYRRHIDARRTAAAAEAARDLVAGLVAARAEQPDMIVEDALCLRLGTLLSEAEHDPIDDRPGPAHIAGALVTAAAAAVETALARADDWSNTWQVLTAVAAILPYPDNEAASEAIARLRNTEAGRALPLPPPGPAVTGPVLWARDRYGSRFAVTAPITTEDQPQRWYLWDIDACGHDAFTVHSGFYPTSQAALAAWQAGVGSPAATDTELAPVDDPWLLAELLPVEQGFMRVGGENVEQFAEYHRSKRLAEAVKQVVRRPEAPPERNGLNAATAATEFAAWLRAHVADPRQPPAELDELATELADSWCLNDVDAVFATCSPHRIALCLLHLRNYYQDDFADRLAALLPDWTRWLTARTDTPPELADRCMPYAQGQPHPQITTDDTGPDYLVRVTE